ncbi:MAG: S1/P1 Nuclease, partial [Cyclobacteriaceae bacterium]|nr:S1/P1 Nuclease [Cyclobacteriaceae bacterium]
EAILRLSADLGHYVADAHVPLHTTENYNGQFTGQEGIHAFWESRVPELLSASYDFWVGSATYETDVRKRVWSAIVQAHEAVDSVLRIERELSEKFGERKYSFETRGRQTVRVYSREFAMAYHQALNGMVQRQMRAAIRMLGDLWFSAWVDAGQPDVQLLLRYTPSEQELEQRKKLL